MAMHRTVYTYSKDGERCYIEHWMSPIARWWTERQTEAANDYHDLIVRRAHPRRDGLWECVGGGGGSGCLEQWGLESTFYAEWQKVPDGVRATITNESGDRVDLVLTRDQRGYVWHTACGEDCGLGAHDSVNAADGAAGMAWGAEVWGLRWASHTPNDALLRAR